MAVGVILLCLFLLTFICFLSVIIAAALGKLWKGGCMKRLRPDRLCNSVINAWETNEPANRPRHVAMQALEWHPWEGNYANRTHATDGGQPSMLCLPSAPMGGLIRDNTRIMAEPRMRAEPMRKADEWAVWQEDVYHGPRSEIFTPVTTFQPPKPVVKLEEVEPSERYTASVTLSEAMWGYGTLLDRFMRKSPNIDGPLDYEGLYFLLRGFTAEQVLLMVLCIEALVFSDAPKYTNRVWTLVLRYYVENSKWEKDERIPPITTDHARKYTKECNNMVLAWHQFERACAPRLEKYCDVKERIKALKQIDNSLPRRKDMDIPSIGNVIRKKEKRTADKENSGNVACENVPNSKRVKAASPKKISTPVKASESLEKKMRSPSAVEEELPAKRHLGIFDPISGEYTYRSIDGELRVFTLREQDVDGFGDSSDKCYVFTQMTKSCKLVKSNLWYVGDLGAGFRVRLQASGFSGQSIDLQFCPGPRKRWQNKVNATPTTS